MSILAVNLKHLYQRRAFWFVYLLLGCFLFRGRFVGFLMLAVVFGLLAAALPVEVLSRPFSFCLPGHRRIPRQFVFVVGVVLNCLGALIFLAYPGLQPEQTIPVICSAFFAGMLAYLLGAAVAFAAHGSTNHIGFLPLLIFAVQLFGLNVAVERVIVTSPLAVIIAGAFTSVVTWFWLGGDRRARRFCGIPYMGLFDVWNREKLQRYSQARAARLWPKLKGHPSPAVEEFFLRRMVASSRRSMGRYLWGALYTSFGMMLSRWPQTIFAFMVFLILAGYIGPGGGWLVILIAPAALFIRMRPPVYSTMLISGGRHERFAVTLVLVAVIAVAAAAMVGLVAALSIPLAKVIPAVTLRGMVFGFQPIDARLLLGPLLVCPFVVAVQLLFFDKVVLQVLSFIILSYLVAAVAVIWRLELGVVINPLSVGLLLLLSWLVFIAVLHRVCTKWCLVRR